MNPFIYQEDYPIVQTKEGALRGLSLIHISEPTRRS